MGGEAQRDFERALQAIQIFVVFNAVPQVDVNVEYAVGSRVERPGRTGFAHLFEHQIHHRGQAHAMLSSTSVAPPQLDEFFCANEAALRAAELAELGYSEVMIWGA